MALVLLLPNSFATPQTNGLPPQVVAGDGFPVFDTGVSTPPATMGALAVAVNAYAIDGDPGEGILGDAVHEAIDTHQISKAFLPDPDFNASQ